MSPMSGAPSSRKYPAAVRGRPVRTRASKNSSGRPATPVLFRDSHRSVLPLRCVAQTRYELLAMPIKSSGLVGKLPVDRLFALSHRLLEARLRRSLLERVALLRVAGD